MKKQLLLALSAGLTISVMGASIANADSNPFQGNQNNQSANTTVTDQTAPSTNNQTNATIQQNLKKNTADGKCGPGKCGPGKCGAGKKSQSSKDTTDKADSDAQSSNNTSSTDSNS